MQNINDTPPPPSLCGHSRSAFWELSRLEKSAYVLIHRLSVKN